MPITYDEYLSRIDPSMLNAQRQFLGPNQGVNFALEGMTPEQAYQSANMQRVQANDDVGLGPGGIADNQQRGRDMLLDPTWRDGPAGTGLVNAFGHLAGEVTKNPALMAAATAGMASYFNAPGFTGEGVGGVGAGEPGLGLSPSTAAPNSLGSGAWNLEASIPDTATSVIQGPGTTMPTGTYGPPFGGGPTATGSVTQTFGGKLADNLTGYLRNKAIGAVTSPLLNSGGRNSQPASPVTPYKYPTANSYQSSAYPSINAPQVSGGFGLGQAQQKVMPNPTGAQQGASPKSLGDALANWSQLGYKPSWAQ